MTLIADNKSPAAHTPQYAHLIGYPAPESLASPSPRPCLSSSLLFSYINFKNTTALPHLLFPSLSNFSSEESRPAVPGFDPIPWPRSPGRQALPPPYKGTTSSVPSSWPNPQHVLCPPAPGSLLECFRPHPQGCCTIKVLLTFYSFPANLSITPVCVGFYEFHCQLTHLLFVWIPVITTSRPSTSASKLWTKNAKQAEGLRADYCNPLRKNPSRGSC